MVAWMAACIPVQSGPTSPPMRMPSHRPAAGILSAAVQQEATLSHHRLHHLEACAVSVVGRELRIGQALTILGTGPGRAPWPSIFT